MRLDEIADHILGTINRYEVDNNIKTLKVEKRFQKDNWAVLTAEKSDRSHTVFYARKGWRADDDKWQYFAISKSEANEGLLVLLRVYAQVDTFNTKARSVFSHQSNSLGVENI